MNQLPTPPRPRRPHFPAPRTLYDLDDQTIGPARVWTLSRTQSSSVINPPPIPHENYERRGWRLCGVGAHPASVYFYNATQRIVTDFDLRANTALDLVSEMVDAQGSASLPPEGWELWIRAPDQGATPIQTCVNHDRRCVERSRADGSFPAVSEWGKLKTAVEDWEFVESHRSHRGDVMGRPLVAWVVICLSLIIILAWI